MDGAEERLQTVIRQVVKEETGDDDIRVRGQTVAFGVICVDLEADVCLHGARGGAGERARIAIGGVNLGLDPASAQTPGKADGKVTAPGAEVQQAQRAVTRRRSREAEYRTGDLDDGPAEQREAREIAIRALQQDGIQAWFVHPLRIEVTPGQ